jgi:hypothetical protein
MIAEAASIFAVNVLAKMGSVMPMQNVGTNRLTKSTTGRRKGDSASPFHLK